MHLPFLLFAPADVILIAISIPLLLRKVGPNGLYGLRVPATFADEWVWYEANARCARDLIVLGVGHLALTAWLSYGTRLSPTTAAQVSAAFLALGVLVVAGIGWSRANRLLAERPR